jgi:MYXO-CTERM domain-containing protein
VQDRGAYSNKLYFLDRAQLRTHTSLSLPAFIILAFFVLLSPGTEGIIHSLLMGLVGLGLFFFRRRQAA